MWQHTLLLLLFLAFTHAQSPGEHLPSPANQPLITRRVTALIEHTSAERGQRTAEHHAAYTTIAS